MKFLVASLTRLGGPGLTLCTLEEDLLTPVFEQGGFRDPNCLCGSSVPGRVFMGSSDGQEGEYTGCVNQLSVCEKGITLERRLPTGGNGPCYMALSAGERFLTVVNYHSGSLSVYALDENGLKERVQFIQLTGHGSNPARQAGPHAHHVAYLPSLPGCLCVADLGTDQLYVYQQDEQTGKLTERYRVVCPAGEGPRHLLHLPDRSYLLTEMGSKVFTVRFNQNGGTVEGGVSALPDGFTAHNDAAAIRLSPDGRTLYTSNRGHDSIAVFDVHDDGTLRRRALIPTMASLPRDFLVLEDGGLLTACQEGGLTLLREGECVCRLPITGAIGLLPIQ